MHRPPDKPTIYSDLASYYLHRFHVPDDNAFRPGDTGVRSISPVASYTLAEMDGRPLLVCPGMPPTVDPPTLPLAVDTYSRSPLDLNLGVFPVDPLAPIAEAIEALRPAGFSLDDVDWVTDQRVLSLFLDWIVDGFRKKRRVDIDVDVHGTLLVTPTYPPRERQRTSFSHDVAEALSYHSDPALAHTEGFKRHFRVSELTLASSRVLRRHGTDFAFASHCMDTVSTTKYSTFLGNRTTDVVVQERGPANEGTMIALKPFPKNPIGRGLDYQKVYRHLLLSGERQVIVAYHEGGVFREGDLRLLGLEDVMSKATGMGLHAVHSSVRQLDTFLRQLEGAIRTSTRTAFAVVFDESDAFLYERSP